MRDGGVDFEGFLGDAFLALSGERGEGTHVVEAIGEFDEDDADILHHGEEHLADAFGLALFARIELEFGELGDAVDTGGDIVAELFPDLFDGDAGIFDQIVQDTGDKAGAIRRHVGEDMGDFERVNEIGLAGLPLLAGVHFQGELEGGGEGRGVFAGMRFFELGEEGLEERI